LQGDARHADRVQPPEQRGLPRPLARLRPLPRRGGDAAGGFRARRTDSSVGAQHNRQNTGESSDRDG